MTPVAEEQKNEPHCAVLLQASAYIVSLGLPLIKASHTTEPRAQVGKPYKVSWLKARLQGGPLIRSNHVKSCSVKLIIWGILVQGLANFFREALDGKYFRF